MEVTWAFIVANRSDALRNKSAQSLITWDRKSKSNSRKDREIGLNTVPDPIARFV
jgi:hypothetical protein